MLYYNDVKALVNKNAQKIFSLLKLFLNFK